jgi:hypothetical protein
MGFSRFQLKFGHVLRHYKCSKICQNLPTTIRASSHVERQEGEVEVLVPVLVCSFLPTCKYKHAKRHSLSPNLGNFQWRTYATFLFLVAKTHKYTKVLGYRQQFLHLKTVLKLYPTILSPINCCTHLKKVLKLCPTISSPNNCCAYLPVLCEMPFNLRNFEIPPKIEILVICLFLKIHI